MQEVLGRFINIDNSKLLEQVSQVVKQLANIGLLGTSSGAEAMPHHKDTDSLPVYVW